MKSMVVMAALLYGPHTPEAEREKRLSTLFDPPPGKLLEWNRISELENTKTPELIKGEIWVRPPKAQCVLIRRDLDKADQKICKPTPIPWKVDDLDSLGRFRLNVLLMEDWDEGTFLTWNTPYRIGNFVAAGDKDTGNFEDILIKTCSAQDSEEGRYIILNAFDGRRWRMDLPEFDQPVMEVEPEVPNLMVNIDSQKKPAHDEKKDGKNDDKKSPESGEKKDEAAGDNKDENGAEPNKKADEKNQKPTKSILGALLSGEYKKIKKPEAKWHIGFRGAFEMESGRFSETGSPKGMTGKCRYIFKNAPGDKNSGAIECHETDTMDSLYVHVPCFSQLKPRLKPKSDSQQEKGR